MAAYESLQALKNAITDRIYTNSSRQISGQDLQEILHDVIDTLDALGSGSDPANPPAPATQYDITEYGLTGVLDGVNKLFSTELTFIPTTTRIYINGVRQFLGIDYTEGEDNAILFTSSPQSGDNIIVDFKYLPL